MNNYRIIIEPISERGEKELPEKLRGGVECEGFVLMSNTAAGNAVILQGVRRIDVAAGIASSDDLMAAAYVAKALRKSKKLFRENDPFS